jgi:flavin-dependent dehydrogenase
VRITYENLTRVLEAAMFDAIIIGARCAGSPSAMLLARKGYRVLLVDRNTFPSDMPFSTHYVH